MKNFVIRICKCLLALMGFAVVSCDVLEVRDEYGTPVMDFTIMGKVVNVQDEALHGINVKCLRSYRVPDSIGVYTDASGAFTIQKEREAFGIGDYGRVYIPIVLEDPNGVYARDTVEVDVKLVASSSSGGHWHLGIFENKDAKIVMKNK